jgi:hypothetical protein
MLQKAKFYLGDDDSITIEGFYNPDLLWNGWYMPLFTKENLMPFLEQMKETNPESNVYYQEETDSIHWEMLEYDFDVYSQANGYNIDGEILHLYPFGTRYLTWDIVEEGE